MEMKDGLPILHFGTVEKFEGWMEEHHATAEGFWMKLAKKNSDAVSVSREEALEVAICFGWIDSQGAGLDDDFWLQRFTPRRARSKWSKINCEKALQLTEHGRMRPAGLREVEAAKQDGRWERAYASPSNIIVPDDLQKELDAHPRAQDVFDGLDGRNRYAILYRIHDAKREDTRRRRIRKFVEMLERGETLY